MAEATTHEIGGRLFRWQSPAALGNRPPRNNVEF